MEEAFSHHRKWARKPTRVEQYVGEYFEEWVTEAVAAEEKHRKTKTDEDGGGSFAGFGMAEARENEAADDAWAEWLDFVDQLIEESDEDDEDGDTLLRPRRRDGVDEEDEE